MFPGEWYDDKYLISSYAKVCLRYCMFLYIRVQYVPGVCPNMYWGHWPRAYPLYDFKRPRLDPTSRKKTPLNKPTGSRNLPKHPTRTTNPRITNNTKTHLSAMESRPTARYASTTHVKDTYRLDKNRSDTRPTNQ